MDNTEIHIASFIVQVTHERFHGLRDWLEVKNSLSIPYHDQQKSTLVVVMETSLERDVNQTIGRIEQQEGVLSVSLVYHQVESKEALEESL